MLLLALIALALSGAAVGMLAWGLLLPRARAEARLEEIAHYGRPAPAAPAGSSISDFRALVARVGAVVSSRMGEKYEARVRTLLMAAGYYNVPVRTVIGYQFLGAAAFAVLVGLAGRGAGILAVPLMAAAFAFAFGAPLIILQQRGRVRVEKIDRALPDLIDMLVVTIEAGLGFNASMQAASTRMGGPLGQELRLTMHEQQMGVSTRDALFNLHARADGQSVHSFVRAVTQGEALGVSIGTIMRDLAKEMRVRRRMDAEERAQKAPVKMLFPLIFLMFPSLGIVILGPAIIDITQKLGS